jgi:hypothetical protein
MSLQIEGPSSPSNSAIVDIHSIKESSLESFIKLPDMEISEPKPLQNRVVSYRGELERKLQNYLQEAPQEHEPRKKIVDSIISWLDTDDEDNEEELILANDSNATITKLPDIFRDLQQLKSLKFLKITNIHDLPNISNLSNLRSLTICNCDSIDQISTQLPQLQNLRTLRILSCNHFTTMFDLSMLKKLTCIDIVSCPIINIKPNLNNNLCNLNVCDCPMLEPLPTSITLPPVINPKEPIISYPIPSRVYDIADVTENKTRLPENIQESFPISGCARPALINHYKVGKNSIVDQPIISCYLLDGEVLEIPLEENLQHDPHLQSNLFIGKTILEHVQKTVLYSTNHMQRYVAILKKDPQDKPPLDPTLLKDVLSTLHKKRSDMQSIATTPLSTPTLKEDSVGNCGEMAVLGQKYGKTLFPDQFIQRVSIKPGDHSFLVIGLPPEINIESYKSWPKSVVICDPWSGACYPASNLEDYLFDFIDSEDIALNSNINDEEKLSPPQHSDQTSSQKISTYSIPRIAHFNPIYQRINFPIF